MLSSGRESMETVCSVDAKRTTFRAHSRSWSARSSLSELSTLATKMEKSHNLQRPRAAQTKTIVAVQTHPISWIKRRKSSQERPLIWSQTSPKARARAATWSIAYCRRVQSLGITVLLMFHYRRNLLWIGHSMARFQSAWWTSMTTKKRNYWP